MKRYWFELVDEYYNDLGAFIPDGNKAAAVKKAKQWMKDNDVKKALLIANSLRTDNLLDIIEIEID